MTDQLPRNPLHGITLEMILPKLVERYGWDEMGRIIRIRCFNSDLSVKSSLQFLRRTPWARNKVEALYLRYKRESTELLAFPNHPATRSGAKLPPWQGEVSTSPRNMDV